MQPTMGVVPGQVYLGTTILEIWEKQVVIGFAGPKEQLAARSITELSRPCTEIHWYQ